MYLAVTTISMCFFLPLVIYPVYQHHPYSLLCTILSMIQISIRFCYYKRKKKNKQTTMKAADRKINNNKKKK